VVCMLEVMKVKFVISERLKRRGEKGEKIMF